MSAPADVPVQAGAPDEEGLGTTVDRDVSAAAAGTLFGAPTELGASAAPSHARGQTNGSANGQAPAGARPDPVPVDASPAVGLLVRVNETGQPAEDRYRLEDLVRVFLEYPGSTAPTLEVTTKGRVVRLDMSFVKVNPCRELYSRLTELLGPGCVAEPAP